VATDTDWQRPTLRHNHDKRYLKEEAQPLNQRVIVLWLPCKIHTSSNFEVFYTTKTKVHRRLSFQQFRQKIRKCSLHTGAPHLRHTNLVLFRCNGLQIWQRFLAGSGPWACAGYRWCQFTQMVHCMSESNIVLLCQVMLLCSQRDISLNFKNEDCSTQLCSWKPLGMVAVSSVFQNSEVLNDNSWNKFLTQIDHKLCREYSARLLP